MVIEKPKKPKACPEPRRRVIVAMSGGIDSSVAAALLKKAATPKDFKKIFGRPAPKGFRGFEVVGVFMKFWSEPFGSSTRIYADSNADLRRYENRCCSMEAEDRARKVASKLGILFYVLNVEKEFKKKVVDYFIKEYEAGRTPNPCVVCNKEIKFKVLLEKALELNADFVSTGHYARLKKEGEIYRLLRARDKEKDQSYFLWQLQQQELKKILFPIGNYTKPEVRALAKKFGLPMASVPESMEVCFVLTSLGKFLKKYIKTKPGRIVDAEGRVLGTHQGLPFYTIGQRKGIGLSGGPFFVLDKDTKKNLLIVTQNEKDLYKKEIVVKDVNWIRAPSTQCASVLDRAQIRAHNKLCAQPSTKFCALEFCALVSDKFPKLPLKVKAKIRYHHRAASATIYHLKSNMASPSVARPSAATPASGLESAIPVAKSHLGIYNLIFNKPQKAVTPGQSVVFYRGEEVLGGGIIS